MRLEGGMFWSPDTGYGYGEIVNKPDVEIIRRFWQTAKMKDVMRGRYPVAFAAGGALAREFGKDDSRIWQMVLDKAVGGKVEIAGIEFSVVGLAEMGKMYRQMLVEDGIYLKCVDEGLRGDVVRTTEVHEHCGACAAVGRLVGKDGAVIEDWVFMEMLRMGMSKQKLELRDSGAHRSLVLNVDFTGSRVPENQRELVGMNALAFNASLPWEWMRQLSPEGQLTVVQWNVGISRNIIRGDHNNFRNLADGRLLVLQGSSGLSENKKGFVSMVVDVFGAKDENVIRI